MATDMTLADVVAKVRRRIQQIRIRHESIGEQNTKATLIDPVLSALGWDTEELDEVCREYKSKSQDNPVDYALFINRTPRLFVEAKDLGAGLSDRKWISQMLGYATVSGVTWCALTNGDEYRFYNTHAPVDVEEKIFRTVRISDESQHDYMLSTLELLSRDKMQENLIDALWKEHFIDRRIKLVLEELLDTQDSSLVRMIRSKLQELSPSDIRDSLKRADIRVDFAAAIMPSRPIQPVSVETDLHSPIAREGIVSPAACGVDVRDLIEAGIIKPPLELEARYHGVRLVATAQPNGMISFDGKDYNSPSMSAGHARTSVIGLPKDGRPSHPTNGWDFWRYRDPDTGKLLSIDNLRRLCLEQRNRVG